jgi:hypothetical protein
MEKLCRFNVFPIHIHENYMVTCITFVKLIVSYCLQPQCKQRSYWQELLATYKVRSIVLSVLHWKHITTSLRTQQINDIGLSVPHRKHIATPLRIQPVNAICRL